MKKNLFALAAFAVLSFSSCKKDWTCHCTYTDPFSGSGATIDYAIKNSTQSDAKNSCNNYATVGGVSWSCGLK